MITFETQKDFEDACMAVLKSRLELSVQTTGFDCVNTVRVIISDCDDYYGWHLDQQDSSGTAGTY